MKFPMLIAQTPRAGRFNHVILLPHAVSNVGTMADFLGAAQADPIGGNYLAVFRRVRQVNASKEGVEILALVGLRVPRKPAMRARVLGWLQVHLENLDEVIDNLDWRQHDGGSRTVVELGEWFGQLTKQGMRLCASWNCSAPISFESVARRARENRIIVLAFVIVLAVVVAWLWATRTASRQITAPEQEEVQQSQ